MKVLRFGNELLGFELLPECGGKIRSLVDRRTGKEWMWRNPALRQRLPGYGWNFERELDTGGWDELFPTVAPCAVDGVAVPDHGDLVSLAWNVTGRGERRLGMRCSARSVPATVEREIRLLDGMAGFVLAYTLSNDSDRSHPFLVATHPLFALERGSRLELPGPAVFRVAGSLGRVAVGDRIRGDRLNALLADGSGGWAMKLFSEPGAVSEVAFHQPDGAGLRMSWDAAELPVLGMWVNDGGWSGRGHTAYRNIGIEPGNASCDALAEAVEAGTAGRLAPGEVRHWEIRVELIR